MRVRPAALLVLIAAAAAASASTTAGCRAPRLAPLRALDDAHGDDFRAAFETASDVPRLIVALSPT